jgi:hypothetical protein
MPEIRQKREPVTCVSPHAVRSRGFSSARGRATKTWLVSNDTPPLSILELAARTVDQVRAAVGVDLSYDSETLPIIDHYLRSVPHDRAETVLLIAITAGAYFGEVVRRALGGEWLIEDDQLADARLVLPWGLSFSPAGMAASTILQSDDLCQLGELDSTFDIEEMDTGLHAPESMILHLKDSLERMSPVSQEEYYSLCGRFDTLEHLHGVVPMRAAHD